MERASVQPWRLVLRTTIEHHDLEASVGLVAAGKASRVIVANLSHPLAALAEVRSEALRVGVVVEALEPGSAHTPLLVRRGPRVLE